MDRITCPLEMRGQCSVYEATGHCFEDVHHDFYPSADYKTGVEKQFRELEINKVQICRAIHNAIHATEEPPAKPHRNQMLGIINAEKEKRKRSA